jgi:hypothetical protein
LSHPFSAYHSSQIETSDTPCATATPRANTGPFTRTRTRFSAYGVPRLTACSFEPDVGQDSDEERILRKKSLQVSYPPSWFFGHVRGHCFILFREFMRCRSAGRSAAKRSEHFARTSLLFIELLSFDFDFFAYVLTQILQQPSNSLFIR